MSKQAWATLLCFGLAAGTACRGDEKLELFVDLQTDLVPGHEFTLAEVFLQRPETLTPVHVERQVTGSDEFLSGARIAEFEGLDAGLHRVIVHLRSSMGALVVERPTSVEMRKSRLVTIVITRDCRGVECDDPDRSACLQGRCVPDTCAPETPSTCPVASCDMAGDCLPPSAACAAALCTAGACLMVPRTPAQCVAELYCDPELGCRASSPDGTLDGGMLDGSTVDAAMTDAGSPAMDAGPPSACENGVRDGDETQVDCGGSCAVACSALYDCIAQTDIPVSECWALVAFYESSNGDTWTDNRNWLGRMGPCSWFGVTCASGHVTVLSLVANGLTGTISPALSNLTMVRTLQLHLNALTGVIPAELGDLANLVWLSLYANQLSGSIPPELGSLTSLTHLSLHLNQLSGSIPSELGNLTMLTQLWLHTNLLTGSLPPELGNLTNLTHFILYSNLLSGSVPAELGNLTSADIFNLSFNQLSGEVPAALMSVPGTATFRLHGNLCLTASGATFLSWLAAKDPLWNDGC